MLRGSMLGLDVSMSFVSPAADVRDSWHSVMNGENVNAYWLHETPASHGPTECVRSGVTARGIGARGMAHVRPFRMPAQVVQVHAARQGRDAVLLIVFVR